MEKISSVRDESSESLAGSRMSVDSDLFEAMRKLKEGVIGLLHKFQMSLAEVRDDKEKAKEVRR